MSYDFYIRQADTQVIHDTLGDPSDNWNLTRNMRPLLDMLNGGDYWFDSFNKCRTAESQLNLVEDWWDKLNGLQALYGVPRIEKMFAGANDFGTVADTENRVLFSIRLFLKASVAVGGPAITAIT